MTATCPNCQRILDVTTRVRCYDCGAPGCGCQMISRGYGRMRCQRCQKKKEEAKKR